MTDRWKTAAETISKVAGFARDNNVISKGLDLIGQNRAADIARAVGAGRTRGKGKKRVAHKSRTRKRHPVKRHVGKKRKMKGGSFLGSLLGKITSIPAGLLMGATAGTQQAISGLGRKRRSARLRQRGGMGTQFVPRQPVGTVSTAPLRFY
jgi:hypothetical protein